MARGDGGKVIFTGKEDRESFLYWLERVCACHGRRIHAWVLMGNYFRLLLETPEPNLSAGMRVLLGTYSESMSVVWGQPNASTGWLNRLHDEVSGLKGRQIRGVLSTAGGKGAIRLIR